MRWIDSLFAWRARRFFRRHLLAAAPPAHARAGSAFDPQATSYYTAKPRPRMAPEDMELDGLDTVEALAPALAELWRQSGRPELVPLAEPLARLARHARRLQIDDEDDVSPFIYMMF